MIKVKVYYSHSIDDSFIFKSKEFGLLEYFIENSDYSSPLHFKNWNELIENGYGHHKNPKSEFEKYVNLVYLGEL